MLNIRFLDDIYIKMIEMIEFLDTLCTCSTNRFKDVLNPVNKLTTTGHVKRSPLSEE